MPIRRGESGQSDLLINGSPKKDMKLGYIHGLFSEAVWRLCIGLGDVRSRVKGACRVICAIPAEHLPADIQPDFKWVVQKLSAAPALFIGKNIVSPSIDVSVDRMKNKTASVIAAKVATIEAKLRDRINEATNNRSNRAVVRTRRNVRLVGTFGRRSK